MVLRRRGRVKLGQVGRLCPAVLHEEQTILARCVVVRLRKSVFSLWQVCRYLLYKVSEIIDVAAIRMDIFNHCEKSLSERQ